MANNEPMDLLKQGVGAWNAWRAKRTEVMVNLANGALRGLDLQGADLSGADLRGADLRGANLIGANLAGAQLEGANLFKAMIDGVDLQEADLRGVRFLHCAQLELAHNWRSAYRDKDLACGAAIPSRRTRAAP